MGFLFIFLLNSCTTIGFCCVGLWQIQVLFFAEQLYRPGGKLVAGSQQTAISSQAVVIY
jgi:hypothetical protein